MYSYLLARSPKVFLRTLTVFALLLIVAEPALALSAHFVGTAVQIDDGDRKIVIKDLISNQSFYGTVHSIKKRGEDYYLVFGTSWISASRPMGLGHCGAGIEKTVKWVRIHDGMVVQQQEGLYMSCFTSIGYSGSGILGWKDGKLTWWALALGSPDRTIEWTYDSAHPENGIKEVVTIRGNGEGEAAEAATSRLTVTPPAK